MYAIRSYYVAHPVGCRHDHLVARVERRHEGVVDRLFAAAGDADLVGRVVEIVVALQLAHDRLAQLWDAGGGRVFGLALGHRLGGRVLDVLRLV